MEKAAADPAAALSAMAMTTTLTTAKPLDTAMTLRDGGGAEVSQCSVFYLLSPSGRNFVGNTVMTTVPWLDGQTDTTMN